MADVRVLIAEDEGLVAEDLQTKVTRMGHAVVATVDSGEEAVRVAAQTDPDLILMDIRLAGAIDGIEAARQIRQQLDAAVIYLTAYSDDQTLARAKETAPFGYLIKPVQGRELQATIEMALHKQELERRLLMSERRWAATLASIGDAVLATDAAGRVTYLNAVAERLTGWRRDEAEGQPVEAVLRLLDGAKRAAAENPVRQVLRDGREVHLANGVLLVARDGTEVPVLDCGAPIFDRTDHLTGCVLVIRDDRERRRAEEERRRFEGRLQQAQKLESLGLLAAGIAHDFNNYLTAVQTYTELALRDLPAASPTRAYLEQALAGTLRATELTQQMLAYAGQGKFLIQAVELSAFVRDMVPLLKASMPAQIELRLRLAEHLPPIEADVAQLRPVVLNLVLNAAESFGPQPGTVTVTTGLRVCDRTFLSHCQPPGDLAEGLYAFLEVADNGCGMTAETLAHIFEPFYTTKPTGRGLGLAAVLGMVRGHKGAVQVASEPNRGTTFTVLFPASARRAAEALPAPPPPAEWRSHGTILVADDDPGIRGLVTHLLTRMGFTVLAAADGQEAVELYRAHADAIRAVVLDLTMPQLDGIAVAEEIRRVRPEACVLLSSGYGEKSAADRMAGQGFAGFLPKPFRLDELQQILRHALGE